MYHVQHLPVVRKYRVYRYHDYNTHKVLEEVWVGTEEECKRIRSHLNAAYQAGIDNIKSGRIIV